MMPQYLSAVRAAMTAFLVNHTSRSATIIGLQSWFVRTNETFARGRARSARLATSLIPGSAFSSLGSQHLTIYYTAGLKNGILPFITECLGKKLSIGRKLLLAIIGALAVALAVFAFAHTPQVLAQSAQEVAAPTPSFEVASIKRERPGDGLSRVGIQFTADGFTTTGTTAKLLVSVAYDMKEFQISGGPNWVDSEKYHLEAKMSESTIDALKKLPADQRLEQRRLMLQSLLAERFKLKLGRSTKTLPIYALVVAKNGPKFSKSDAPPSAGGAPPLRRFMARPGELTLAAGPISSLTEFLSQEVGRNVVDKTGLQGRYDLSLHWTPDRPMRMPGGPSDVNPGPGEPAADSGPSVFTALQEQLGLKLESEKGPVECLVIDSIEKPTEN